MLLMIMICVLCVEIDQVMQRKSDFKKRKVSERRTGNTSNEEDGERREG